MTALLVIDVPAVASWERMRLSRGRSFKSDEAKMREALIAHHALAVRPRGWDLSARYAVTVLYHPPDNRARDCDRVANLVLDALTGVLWLDDSDKHVASCSAVCCEGVHGHGHVLRFNTLDGLPLTTPSTMGLHVAEGNTVIVVERVAGKVVKARKPQRSRRVVK